MNVQYPDMRERLVTLLRDANDPTAETRWLNDRGGFNDWFNDLDWLASDDTAQIGTVLIDEREAEAVKAVRVEFDAMFSGLADVGFADYQSNPRWAELQRAAREAVAVIDPANALRPRRA